VKLAEDLATLAEFSEAGPGVTRLAWSPPHIRALRWLAGRLEEAGLDAQLDAAGNCVGRWAPNGAEGQAIGLGSHIDSVPAGGRFDGTLGVLGALAAIELLRERAFVPTTPVWLMSFMDEEGTRFGESMFGSRAFVGEDLDAYLSLSDSSGATVGQAMQDAGFSPDDVRAARAVAGLSAFLELHVEQGKVLLDAGVDIGVVNAIVGLLQARVVVRGVSDHGSTPMPGRHDALAAAARMIVALRDWARDESDMTATVGSMEAWPGAYNTIPGKCSFSVDLRVPDRARFATLRERLTDLVAGIAAQETVEVGVEITDFIQPAELDERLLTLIERAAETEGASHMRMPSGAGHDSQVLAPYVPTAMVFVPSAGGVSHSPEEFTTPAHCELGARVLARVIELAQGDAELLGPDA
jgi:hydantoinase/carbamoylase family amidase